ncbi:unnamed protein product [Adineta steineri]|uniref:Glucose-methanol-choline oxidoreductase C-terminal domain-containing protein n=1 Tax=Adineta steineri TaxID=433720 RepID=A0A815AHJ9_9BILA|nr:unnamed protein product [Adineta steineri]CAF1548414.1 unnamed protein product [Adineta steineri]
MTLTNPKAKILVLERGSIYLSEHRQHYSTPLPTPGDLELRPWSISPETLENEYVQKVCGQIPFLGGRSTHWSGWSPTPSTKELAGWPNDLKMQLQKICFGLAQKFLGVIEANEINAFENGNYLYGTFQSGLKSRLDSADTIESVDDILHAPLAMGNDRSIKFSTVERLLSMENVTVIYECTAEEILHDGKKATGLRTSQGTIEIPNNTKLILAMSTLPATTLVLNSFESPEFPQLSNVGKRFTAHSVTSVIARVPRQNLSLPDNAPDVELGAVYISGIKDGGQYHLQLSGVAYTQCNDTNNIHDICKKYTANSIPKECIDRSRDDIVVSCSTLGELDYKNKSNQFNLTNNNRNLTTNGELTFHLNDQDNRLWDLMDSVTFEVMNKLSCSANGDDLEYWHETDKKWKKDPPPSDQIRNKNLVHDASTMWIGDNEDTEAPVGLDYRLKGVNNVYLTGGALWPTGGSWNPVLTIVAMAMHLADTM